MELEYINESNIEAAKEEAMQFMKFPVLLFKDQEFKKMSIHAKVLYSMMLDRTGLSLINKERFTDKDGRAFIFFSWEEAMELLDCGRQKMGKVFDELEDYHLIERVSCGVGRPTKLYVKRFIMPKREKIVPQKSAEQHDPQRTAEYDSQTQEFENRTPYIESDLPQPDLPFLDPLSSPCTTASDADRQKQHKPNKPESYEEQLKKAQQQVSSDRIKQYGTAAITELSAVIAWANTTPKETLQVGGIPIRTSDIRTKLQFIQAKQAEEVLHNLVRSKPKIRNRRSYLLTCLYNAVDNCDNTYHRKSDDYMRPEIDYSKMFCANIDYSPTECRRYL